MFNSIEIVKFVTNIILKNYCYEKDIQKFFESLDYDKADVSADRLYVKVKFYGNIIKIKDYPFPTEESKGIFEKSIRKNT